MTKSKIYDIVQNEWEATSNKKTPLEHFIIPYKNKKYIIYFPLKGIVSLVNKKFIDNIEKNDGVVKSLFNYADSQPTIETLNYTNNSIHIDLTHACNLRCVYCYAHGGENPKYIDWKTAKAGIDYRISRCKHNKFKITFHGGGEPLLAFDMMKRCYDYAKKNGDKRRIKILTTCATNGTLVTEDIAKWMKKVRMIVLLSFDGLPELQNKQRPFADKTSSYPVIENTIKLFNKYKVDYRAHATITENSVDKMEDIIKHLHKLGVKKYSFEAAVYCGRYSQKKKRLLYKNYENNLNKAKKLAKKYNIIFARELTKIDELPKKEACGSCGSIFAITPDKHIVSCLTATNSKDPIHNLFCYGKIKDGKVIIDNKKLNYLKNRKVNNMKQCKDCFAKYNCSGGCLSEAVRNTHSLYRQTEEECIKGKIKTMEIIENMLK